MKEELERLSAFARSEPHAAYSAYTHSLIGKWTYVLRSIEGLNLLLKPLEDNIRQQFLTALTGTDSISDMERELLALLARHGGLGVINPRTKFKEHTLSRLIAPITALIVQQNSNLAPQQQQAIKRTLITKRHRRQAESAIELKYRLPQPLRGVAELGTEKGAYSWLTALPIARHGCTLHKGALRDALCLRYNWPQPGLPRECLWL